MALKSLLKAFEIIDNIGGDFEGEKDEKLLEKAEISLGVSFPPTYRAFLKRYGCGDVLGFEIYGLIGEDFENSKVPDTVWLNLTERQSGLSEHYIIISSLGEGSYYVLNTSITNVDGENPVYLINDIKHQTKIADDFGDFLLNEIQSLL